MNNREVILKESQSNQASREDVKMSFLEKEYVKHYGQEFVDDLKLAYEWMRLDMENYPEATVEANRKKRGPHEIGDWVIVFFVDFDKGDLYAQTVDDTEEKTIVNVGNATLINVKEDKSNVKYLLSGLFFYSKSKARRWLKELFNEDGAIVYVGA